MKERRNLLFQMQTVAIKDYRNANPRLHLQKTTLFPHIVFYNKKNRMGHRWPIRIMKKKGGVRDVPPGGILWSAPYFYGNDIFRVERYREGAVYSKTIYL